MMPGKNGVDVLKELKIISPSTEVIMVTGNATLETAVESMKLGAFDYIKKPYTMEQLCTVFDKALEHHRLKTKVNYLEELDRLKSDFVATMSHELRTPLASTMGYISLLHEGVYGALTDAQKTALERAQINSKNLLQLINSVLDFSKLKANKMLLTPETFNLEELVKEVAMNTEPLAASRQLLFDVKCPSGVSVHCDRHTLRQILTNLLANAVKFTNTGSISLHVKLEEDGSHVDFRIRDTGIGIPSEKLPLLFQDFRQIDSSTTRKYSGTGLGLSISKRLAELMGGTIQVHSEYGVGSEFTIRLPIR
jgi:signal transduction histidine kinase